MQAGISGFKKIEDQRALELAKRRDEWTSDRDLITSNLKVTVPRGLAKLAADAYHTFDVPSVGLDLPFKANYLTIDLDRGDKGTVEYFKECRYLQAPDEP